MLWIRLFGGFVMIAGGAAWLVAPNYYARHFPRDGSGTSSRSALSVQALASRQVRWVSTNRVRQRFWGGILVALGTLIALEALLGVR